MGQGVHPPTPDGHVEPLSEPVSESVHGVQTCLVEAGTDGEHPVVDGQSRVVVGREV